MLPTDRRRPMAGRPREDMIVGAGSVPSKLSGAVITASVRCRRCGYDLRGLAAEGVCPECGLETWASLRDAVDPTAGRLPQLADPVGVAWALLWLTGCQLATMLLLVARPLALWVDQLDPTGRRDFSLWTPPGLTVVAGLVALAGLWSVWKMLPAREQRGPSAVRPHSVVVLGVGLATCGALLAGASLATLILGGMGVSPAPDWHEAVSPAYRLMLGVAAIACYLGLRGVLRVIGQRSREYRTAKGGRQRVRDVIAAIVGVMVGEVVGWLGVVAAWDWLAGVGRMVVWVSVLMLLIGQVYLVLNAWWISRALRRPRPGLRDVLGPALPPGRVIHPPREDEVDEDTRGP